MDRLNRAVAGAGLAVALTVMGTATGCRSMRPEVPPGRSFTPDGQQTPAIGFSSTPGTPALSGIPTNPGTGAPGSPTNAAGQVGLPTPGGNTYSTPTVGAYGAPGTSGGLGASPSLGAATGAGLAPATAPGGASDPSTGIPQTGTSPLGR
jgi:hypothetical protein